VRCYVAKSFRDSTISAKGQQMAQWLNIVSWIAVILGLLPALVIAFDVTAHPQHMKIMNVVWPITGLYLPVFGWLLYADMARRSVHNSGLCAARPPRIQVTAAEFEQTIGFLHSGRRGRSDFVLDLMEPLRPVVDRRLLEFVQAHAFHPADFTIRSDGVCRLNPEMARHVVRQSGDFQFGSPGFLPAFHFRLEPRSIV
jgi:hypothetical protein